ncbi:cysteine-rich small domain-containing protein [Archaeoglobus neptunius]|uniref:cysteine-rich small domain-containing protein n=1 Tax=Archaeoglobus neptunius TaxID=2798580 RepID=UPI00192583F8|nr:cysteine-rich small domain-containing protein [Archaeoglobus neptunius]
MNPRERSLIDLFAAMEDFAGPALECNYYPCHFDGQDCSICFCPFYPCLIYQLGGELVVSSSGRYVWSCKNCTWIHEKENVEEIVTYFTAFPRQLLVEEGWHFFSKSLQEIIFGEEVGWFESRAYNLMPANFFNKTCETVVEGEFLDVILHGFEIISVRRIVSPEEAEGVIIPKKSGETLIGLIEGEFVRCTL